VKKRIVVIIAIIAAVVAAAGIGFAAYLFRGGAAPVVNVTELSLGEKYLADLNYEKAAAALQHVITVEPNNAEAYLALAKTYRYMGDVDTARETLENGYGATSSAVIRREIDELQAGADPVLSDHPAVFGAPVIEIGGESYPADATELVLRERGLSDADLQKLTAFTNLERLDISGNGITDISAIANLTALKKFYAARNAIADVSPLVALQSLEYVGLRENQIANADALFGIGSLKYLHLSENQITAVPGIGEGLQLLYLAENQIGDTSAIKNAGLAYYDVNGNPGM
jgi:tetratricopeptide (TPR) repeat protein